MGIEDEEATVFLDQEKTEIEEIGKVLVEDEITSKQVTDELTHKQKLIHSFIYFNAFVQLGVVTGMIGPLLWVSDEMRLRTRISVLKSYNQ